MTPADVVVLVVIGLLAGVLAGAFGVGGGLLLVPGLVLLIGFQQGPAAATSLLAIIPAAVSGTVANHARSIIRWRAAALLACGGMAGAVMGTLVAINVDEVWLRWAFIVYLVVAAARLLLPRGRPSGAPLRS